MGKARERQIILKTDQRTCVLELGLGGKLQVRSSGSDENRTFLEGDVLEVAVRDGRWVPIHVLAGPRPAPPPAEQIFPTEQLRRNGVCDTVTWGGNAVALRRNESLAGNQPVRSRYR
jgi:hypothetical protein